MDSDSPTAEAARLLDRYLIGLDDDTLDDTWARALFTEDARVEFPFAAHQGLAGMAAWHRASLAAFAATQHLGGPAVTDQVAGDRVRLRANLVSTHVHHPGADGDPLFTAGTFVTGEARRTGEGWRLASLSFRTVWSAGSPPGRAGNAR